MVLILWLMNFPHYYGTLIINILPVLIVIRYEKINKIVGML